MMRDFAVKRFSQSPAHPLELWCTCREMEKVSLEVIVSVPVEIKELKLIKFSEYCSDLWCGSIEF